MKIGAKHTEEAIKKIKEAAIGRKAPRTAFKKGFTPWNKGLKTGLVPKSAFKKDDPRLLGEAHHNWKGDKVSYFGLHIWVNLHKGKAKKCEYCGSKINVQWANKSFKYKRDLDDWLELCYKCHRRYDLDNGWGEAVRKFSREGRLYI